MSMRPDGESNLWGVNSSAEMFVRRAVSNEEALDRIGFRGPKFPGLPKVFGSGVVLAVSYRDSTVVVPRASLPAKAPTVCRDGTKGAAPG